MNALVGASRWWSRSLLLCLVLLGVVLPSGVAGQATPVASEAPITMATGERTSPATGTTYPSGWVLKVPSAALAMTVTLTFAFQELDTRQTTGVIYWEGEALVEGLRGDDPVSGLAYVGLTGYAPYVPLDLGTPLATPER